MTHSYCSTYSEYKVKLFNPFKNKIAERLHRLPASELMLWTDSLLPTIWRSLEGYDRSGEPLELDEAHKDACVLLAIIDELRERYQAKINLM